MKSLSDGVRVGGNAVSISLADRVDNQRGVIYGQQEPNIATIAPAGDNSSWGAAMKNAVNPPQAKAGSLADAFANARLEELFKR